MWRTEACPQKGPSPQVSCCLVVNGTKCKRELFDFNTHGCRDLWEALKAAQPSSQHISTPPAEAVEGVWVELQMTGTQGQWEARKWEEKESGKKKRGVCVCVCVVGWGGGCRDKHQSWKNKNNSAELTSKDSAARVKNVATSGLQFLHKPSHLSGKLSDSVTQTCPRLLSYSIHQKEETQGRGIQWWSGVKDQAQIHNWDVPRSRASPVHRCLWHLTHKRFPLKMHSFLLCHAILGHTLAWEQAFCYEK